MPTDLYLRRATLVLVQGTTGLDLSDTHFRFNTVAADVESPNTAFIRIYNLKEETIQRIRGEFSRVVLNAGYKDGSFGVIFDGTIKQKRYGRESNINRYIDIFASAADEAFNFGVVSASLEKGSTPEQRARAISQAWDPYGVSLGPTDALQGTGGILPRGKVLFGMARNHMRRLTASTGTTWSIQDGKVTIIPLTGYKESEAVVLTSRTGMIGIPEATDNGILVTSLMNPKIQVGTRVRIDNKSINATQVIEQGFPAYTSLSFPASVANDGFYRVLVVEHEGDTRGQEWYTNMTCLSIDPSVSPDQSVQAYG